MVRPKLRSKTSDRLPEFGLRINHRGVHSCQKSTNFSVIPTYSCLHLSDHVLAGLSFAIGASTVYNGASARFLMTNHVLVFSLRRLMLDHPLSNCTGACLLTNHLTVVSFWSLKFDHIVKICKTEWLLILFTWFEFITVSDYLVNGKYIHIS